MSSVLAGDIYNIFDFISIALCDIIDLYELIAGKSDASIFVVFRMVRIFRLVPPLTLTPIPTLTLSIALTLMLALAARCE